jgi:dienelactone hydrolase
MFSGGDSSRGGASQQQQVGAEEVEDDDDDEDVPLPPIMGTETGEMVSAAKLYRPQAPTTAAVGPSKQQQRKGGVGALIAGLFRRSPSPSPSKQPSRTQQGGGRDLVATAANDSLTDGTVIGQLSDADVAAQLQLRTKRVLVGHSMGGVCAALETLRDPERVAALVLVAPAIFALPAKNSPTYTLRAVFNATDAAAPVEELLAAWQPAQNTTAGQDTSQSVGSDAGRDGEGSSSRGRQGQLVRAAQAVARAVALGAALLLLMAFRPAIIWLLRALVRSRDFWLRGLQQAYYDPSQVTDQVRVHYAACV